MEQILYSVLSAVGGAGVLALFFIKWVMDVQKDRINNNETHELSKNLEEFKSEITSEINKQNLAFNLYFSGQFDIYSKLWASIVELEEAVDQLWETVDKKRFDTFVKAVNKAKKNVKTAAPFIEEEHHKLIESFFKQIDEYRHGKQNLLEYQNVSDDVFNENLDIINGFVELNRDTRESIHSFSKLCLKDFREKLKGETSLDE